MSKGEANSLLRSSDELTPILQIRTRLQGTRRLGKRRVHLVWKTRFSYQNQGGLQMTALKLIGSVLVPGLEIIMSVIMHISQMEM
jgi:hypothetical protein